MSKCPQCGAEHNLLDPVFVRPDDYAELDEQTKEKHAKADDDLCRISLPDQPERHFVRGTLPVSVDGDPEGLRWGAWAEIDYDALHRILELWTDEKQADESPFEGTFANEVPGYPDTRGFAVRVVLTGPTTRPDILFAGDSTHPFVRQCRAGVDAPPGCAVGQPLVLISARAAGTTASATSPDRAPCPGRSSRPPMGHR